MAEVTSLENNCCGFLEDCGVSRVGRCRRKAVKGGERKGVIVVVNSLYSLYHPVKQG